MPTKKSTSTSKSEHRFKKNRARKNKTKVNKKKSTKKIAKKTKKKLVEPSLFAVIKTGGKQYKLKEKDIIKVNRLEAKEGDEVEFNDVLLIADKDNIKIGTPCVSKAKVKARVLEQGKDKKIIVLKYKPKKRYRKTYGHRQKYTKLEIKKILTK